MRMQSTRYRKELPVNPSTNSPIIIDAAQQAAKCHPPLTIVDRSRPTELAVARATPIAGVRSSNGIQIVKLQRMLVMAQSVVPVLVDPRVEQVR